MSEVVIRAEGLGKKYLIGHQAERERYTALRDVLTRTAKGLARSAADLLRGRQLVSGGEVEEFWALKDVSFEIKRGEVAGIIGRNGAGKSTLLKILSRITEPSKGRVEIKGRVATLLEVGTGFHPELTGRENIYLNGAILGMTRAEIKRKFDEIVAFAEVETFLDTPVKRYSSGMYVRLAFAVAAHLEPEILVVDEVLAVGDAEFQKKCLGKMRAVASHGRTVLFVSHSMQAVSALCDRALLLARGQLAEAGSVDRIIGTYLSATGGPDGGRWVRSPTVPIELAGFEELRLTLNGDQPNLKLHCIIGLRVKNKCANALLAVDISGAIGTRIMQALPSVTPFLPNVPGYHELALEIALPPLIPGTYFATFWMGPHNNINYDMMENAIAFEVLASPAPGRTFPHTPDHGYVVPFSNCVLRTGQINWKSTDEPTSGCAYISSDT